MKNFNRDNRSSAPRGRRDFGAKDFGGGGRKFGGQDAGRSSMYQAVCSDCGQPCEVPFKPSGDRPVYCRACFEKHGNAGPGRSGGKSFSRSGFDDKKLFQAVCASCGKNCEVPFRPTGGKPIYCNQCFGKGGTGSGKGSEQITRQQFEVLNAKLDKILKAVAPAVVRETAQEAKPVQSAEEMKKSKGSKASAKATPKKTKTKKK